MLFFTPKFKVQGNLFLLKKAWCATISTFTFSKNIHYMILTEAGMECEHIRTTYIVHNLYKVYDLL